MNVTNARKWFLLASFALATLFAATGPVLAHCDGMDGPVIKAAKRALATGEVDLVLIWVQPEDEATIKAAFQKTMEVRKLSPEAKQLADRYFFETLVRVHRAGEGAPYTGLKPAGRDLGPVIPAADKAISNGTLQPLLALLPSESHARVRRLFHEVISKKNFQEEDVETGREYVEAYVAFVHEVEALHGGDKHGAGHDHSAKHASDIEHRPHGSRETQRHHKPIAGLAIPEPLKQEHEELHEQLAKVTQEDGEVGEAAKALADLLHPHLAKEEEHALPLLGLLVPVTKGTAVPEAREAVAMAGKLKAELRHMLEEHRQIVVALNALRTAASKKGNQDVVHLCEKLKLHARTEEEVLYPAAVLIGEYLKLAHSH